MAEKHDMSNPLIATPVAYVAAQLWATAGNGATVRSCVANAEILVGELIERGHLPLTTETEDEKQGDPALILTAILHGLAVWKFYGPGDPRGILTIGDPGVDQYQHETKLVKGVPHLSDAAREQLEQRVQPFLRRL